MSDGDAAWLAKPPWKPVNAPRTCGPDARRAQEYVDICAQFDVVHAWRYQPRSKTTFCNIYVWDCTRALGCEIPHWYEPKTGAATAVGNGKEMTANAMYDWLDEGQGGWRGVEDRVAVELAGMGFPVVAAWKNPEGIGHVAMVFGGGLIAQAGARNLWLAPLPQGFGKQKPSFFTHV